MPELPEVETVVRGLRPLLVGRTIAGVTLRREGLRQPFPPDLGQRLTGAQVESLGRRAKFGLVHLQRGAVADTLVFHLGMSGRFHLLAGAPGRHDHLLLALAKTAARPAETLALNDVRRFGSVDLVATAALPSYPPLARLGPEPLSPAFTGKALAAICAGHQRPIKTLLMDSHRIAGLGNIYAAEALFRARIHPGRAARSLTAKECSALAKAIHQVLEEALLAGGSTLRDYRQPGGEGGYFQHQFDVYHRRGLPCHRCATPIAEIRQAGRSTFFCPHCQPESPQRPLDALPLPR